MPKPKSREKRAYTFDEDDDTVEEEEDFDTYGSTKIGPFSAESNPISSHPAQASAAIGENYTSQVCSVCLETLNARLFPKRKITASCTHGANVCLGCIRQSISSQFTSKLWDQISCPSCNERLEHHDVKLFAEPTIFER